MSDTVARPSGLDHFVCLADVPGPTVRALLDYALYHKRLFAQGGVGAVLAGKSLAMIFQKPSLRTRISFEVAMTQLGGHAINLDNHHIQLGKREPVRDIARVLSRMCDGIVARVFAHGDVEELARYATVPVINGLSDAAHPCQAMADMMTIAERFGGLDGRRVAYVGDGNNVARSLAWACAKLGVSLTIASPESYQLPPALIEAIRQQVPTADVRYTTDPIEAVCDADVVSTDTWTSMGQEDQREQRIRDFAAYQVNAELLRHAQPHAVVMHCLPAYRGLEITDDVIEGPQSVVFEQAENRLHFQRALLDVLMTSSAEAPGPREPCPR